MLTINELFGLISSKTTDEEKINTMQQYKSSCLLTLLNYIYNPEITFDVEISWYTVCKEAPGMEWSSLWKEYRRLYIFRTEYSKPGVSVKKKNALINILESIPPADAKILELILRKEYVIDGVSLELVSKTFPELGLKVTNSLPEPVFEKVQQKKVKRTAPKKKIVEVESVPEDNSKD